MRPPADPRRPAAASPLFLREAEIRRGLELLFFGQGHLNRAADELLAVHGLGRAHHRVLYFVARRPDVSVGELLQLLGITKQSLGRVVTELASRGLVEARAGRNDRRQRLLRLTDTGATLESQLFETLRSRLAAAYGKAGPEAVAGFWTVLEALIPPAERARVATLGR